MTSTVTPQADQTPKEPETAAALHAGSSDLRALLTRNLRTSGIYIAFVAIVALFAILTDGVSLSPNNITNIVLQYSYILVLAIGMVIVIIAGHIDLSVGSVVALTGAVSAILVIKNGYPWWVGILAALVVGLLVGAWQGFWVAYVGIPAFIVTLAGMLLFRGLTLQCSTTSRSRRSRRRTRRSRADSSTAGWAATASTRSPCSSGRWRWPDTR
jgi:putative multiple sugar transport system permease protein